MKNKLHKEHHQHIADGFIEALKKAFFEEFDVDLKTTWNLWHLHLISYRTNGVMLTVEQTHFIEVYEAGFVAALELIDKLDEDVTL